MLRLVGPGDETSLREFCRGSALGCRIWSLCRAYGTERDFACFWMQDKQRAAVGMLDHDAVLLTGPQADFEELGPFLRAVGASRLLCSDGDAHKIGSTGQRGQILRKNGGALGKPAENLEENPSLREIYELLLNCAGPGMNPPDFEPFYLDLSYRIRHGAARTVGIRNNGRLGACAVGFETENEILLSSVAVLPELRGYGYGGAVSSGLLCLSQKPKAFLFCLPERAGFYRRLGFQPDGVWAECEL